MWDIHFAVLREYLAYRGIDVSPDADEKKLDDGRSSGVARILKFAESMVHVFNMDTRDLDSNLNMLAPQTKVVVFNLSRLHGILKNMRPDQLNKIRFIGDELILPESDEISGSAGAG